MNSAPFCLDEHFKWNLLLSNAGTGNKCLALQSIVLKIGSAQVVSKDHPSDRETSIAIMSILRGRPTPISNVELECCVCWLGGLHLEWIFSMMNKSSVKMYLLDAFFPEEIIHNFV